MEKRKWGKLKVLKKGISPIRDQVKCPICGNLLDLIINRNTGEIEEIYADAEILGGNKIKCGECSSILQYESGNPSRRK